MDLGRQAGLVRHRGRVYKALVKVESLAKLMWVETMTLIGFAVLDTIFGVIFGTS